MSALIWYMRDNHTFLRLCNDAECAIKQIAQEWDEPSGTKYGMLCSKHPGAPKHVQAREDLETFSAALRAYYTAFPFDTDLSPNA